MTNLKVVDHLFNTSVLRFCFPPAKLCALVVPGPLLLVVHEARLTQLALAHTIGHHQALVVGVLVLGKSRRVQTNLAKK